MYKLTSLLAKSMSVKNSLIKKVKVALLLTNESL